MEEVIERARKAIVFLEELIKEDEENGHDTSSLRGKVYGIKLVIGYYEEWLRDEVGAEE